MTLRDDVWNAVLKELVRNGKFVISDLPFDESQRHTVRRTLRTMESLEWLSRENDRAATWRMGENAELHLNVSRERIQQARE